MQNLEGGELDEGGRPKLARGSPGETPAQMMLFGAMDYKLREELKKIDVSLLTPVEALNLLDGAVVFFTSDHGEILDEKFDGYGTRTHV